jgi:hypothetical protein
MQAPYPCLVPHPGLAEPLAVVVLAYVVPITVSRTLVERMLVSFVSGVAG